MAFDKDAFLTSLDSMSVMELNELVKAIEEKFGVSAAGVEHIVVNLGRPDDRSQFGLGLADVPRRRPFETRLVTIGVVPVHYLRVHDNQRTPRDCYSQVCTGALLCICSQYRRSISASAVGRSSPRSSSAPTVPTCQAAPLRPVFARPSMTPR